MEKKLHQLTIDDLAIDGKAVAHRDGKVVFLDAGLPGETVLAEITASKPRFDRGVVHEIVEKSPLRIEAVCTHFGICGGCSWQDLEYPEQLKMKKRHVVQCLSRIGGLQDPVVADVLPCESIFNYRNKMEYSFHVVNDDDFHLGLHRRGRYDDIFDLKACHLQSDVSNRIVHAVRSLVRQEKIPVYNVNNHTGFLRFLVIRQASRTGQVMVIIVTSLGDLPAQDKLVASLTEQFPQVTTIIHGQNGKKSNIAVAEIETILYGPGYIEEEILGRRFKIKANSFFQTNSLQAERLYQTAFDLLQPKSDARVLDLYCGTGTIGLLLASQVKEVIGVELVPDALEMARENAALNGLDNVSFFQGHVKEFLKEMGDDPQAFEAVIVDPPRAGLHPKALKRLIRLNSPRILYISCNPATFARDAGSLSQSGYKVTEIRPVDMFPHTRHIELAAVFHR
jgi:23S rRNA (uracil1939-C5)-methyltransferase